MCTSLNLNAFTPWANLPKFYYITEREAANKWWTFVKNCPRDTPAGHLYARNLLKLSVLRSTPPHQISPLLVQHVAPVGRKTSKSPWVMEILAYSLRAAAGKNVITWKRESNKCVNTKSKEKEMSLLWMLHYLALGGCKVSWSVCLCACLFVHLHISTKRSATTEGRRDALC